MFPSLEIDQICSSVELEIMLQRHTRRWTIHCGYHKFVRIDDSLVDRSAKHGLGLWTNTIGNLQHQKHSRHNPDELIVNGRPLLLITLIQKIQSRRIELPLARRDDDSHIIRRLSPLQSGQNILEDCDIQGIGGFRSVVFDDGNCRAVYADGNVIELWRRGRGHC